MRDTGFEREGRGEFHQVHEVDKPKKKKSRKPNKKKNDKPKNKREPASVPTTIMDGLKIAYGLEKAIEWQNKLEEKKRELAKSLPPGSSAKVRWKLANTRR